MDDSRLNKLCNLLESRNRILRLEAISTLTQFAPTSSQQTTYSWNQLFDIVTQCFRSSLWECRVASAELIASLLENADNAFHDHFELLFTKSLDKIRNNFDECATLIDKFDLCQIVTDYKVLVGFDEDKNTSFDKNKQTHTKKQRQLIDQHLDMNSATGISSSTFITDDELSTSNEVLGSFLTNSSLSSSRKELYLEVSDDNFPVDTIDYCVSDTETIPHLFLQSYIKFFRLALLRDLVNPKWQIRHGAALVLTQICNHADKWIYICPSLLTVIAIRLFQLLCLDRFCDFVTGSNVIAPVREAASQALSFIMLRLLEFQKHKNGNDRLLLEPFLFRIGSAILNQICNMLQMESEQNWHCRLAALLVAKYHFAVTTFSLSSDYKLFDLTLCALEHDPVDEVVSASSQAISAFFIAVKSGVSRIDINFLTKIRQETLPRLWNVLQHPERLTQLCEGVDSVLVDLLGLLEFWLCTDNWQMEMDRRNSQPSIQLNANQISLLVELIEASSRNCPTARNQKVMKCLCSIFENDFLTMTTENEHIWTEKLLFQLLKRLYRCVLFCPPNSAETLLSCCQTTLSMLLKFSQRHMTCNSILDKLLSNDLALNIGFWISCLMYDHKNPEIDVFLHNIDGLDSRKSTPKELLCGEELHFFDKKQIDMIVLERKAMAAKWLATLIDALFRWGKPIGQQPMFVSVQLLFLPYFRSNSLYQKLGAALLTQEWSTIYQNNSIDGDNTALDNQSVLVPDILIKELYEQLSCNLNSNKLFDETVQLVNILTRETNDFKQYCLRKGVPVSELLPLNQVTSMEEAVNSAYISCGHLLEKADDLRALAARHALIIELIEDTKLATRTYISRINALFSSALLNFMKQSSLPMQLTPLVKPLMDSIESESSTYITNYQLVNAFFTLIERTSKRKPCPHSKILRQLLLGLGQCDLWAPKSLKWNERSTSHVISLEESSFKDLPCGIKARNCVIILRSICEKFGSQLSEICPEMINGFSLDMLKDDNEEEFLLRLDFFGVIFPAFIDKHMRLSFIKEKIAPNISHIMRLLSSANPAIRFRVSRFLSNLTEVELCPMLRIFFQTLLEMLSDTFSTSVLCAKLGVSELLLRLSNMHSKLLGAVSLLSPLALRCIGDRNESVRAAASFAFREFVTLLPLENKQKHFLHELFNDDEDNSGTIMLKDIYLNSFNLVDVLGCPGNLPKLKRNEIPFLNDNFELREYQIEGITWLSFLSRFGLNGILADDMGLGKTVQVLSLFSWDYAQRNIQTENVQTFAKDSSHFKSSLIVCPRTLVDHWCREWNSYFLSSQIHFQKLANYRERRSFSNEENQDRVLVISYEELRSSKELSEQYWHYVVLDEGHCIRNPSSQLFGSVCALNCSHRLILSGTPVQNSPADLWALFTFLMPGYLSSRSVFHSKYMRHIIACRNEQSNEQQIKDGEQALESLHRQCLPFILRRLKTEVLAELPEKIVQDRECELSVLQRQLYQMIVEFCSLNARDLGSKEKRWLTPIQVLHALRKLVDHPFLIAKLVQSLRSENVNYKHMADQCMQLHVEQSGKMLALRELLNECQIGEGFYNSYSEINQKPEQDEQRNESQDVNTIFDGFTTNNEPQKKETTISSINPETQNCFFTSNTPHKALIFCQWRATIELISHFLNHGSLGAGINFLVLDGQTPPNQRQLIVDRFNTDPSIQLLLLTTHVGGVGLNLTSADVVIFMDHDWNPFRDLQAIDRAHRLGQKRVVNVFRLITMGTVEEKVMRLQRFKTDTANALIGVENRSLASMATDELLELLSLKGPGINSDVNVKGANLSKKSRMNSAASCSTEAGVWSVDELWGDQKDETDVVFDQYIDSHSVEKFLNSRVS